MSIEDINLHWRYTIGTKNKIEIESVKTTSMYMQDEMRVQIVM